jgi:hypothetical protein
MTWSGEVALIFLQVLYDPELILYLLSVAKPIHFKYLIDEAKLFHESLRISREERWAKVKELSRLRKFNQMNSLVPVSCSLPFDNGMWKNSCELLKSIRYMREGFIRKKYPVSEDHCEDIDLEIPLKIKCINLMLDEDKKYIFMPHNDWDDYIDEALEDLVKYQNEGEQEHIGRPPYILIEIWHNGIIRSGYSTRTYNYTDNTKLYLRDIIN